MPAALNVFTPPVLSTTVDAGATLDANGPRDHDRQSPGSTLTNDARRATFTINSGAFSGRDQDGVSPTSIIKNGRAPWRSRR